MLILKHNFVETLICIYVSALLVTESAGCPSTCDMTGINNICKLVNGTVYNGHCYYWTSTKYWNIDDSSNDCKMMSLNLSLTTIQLTGTSVAVSLPNATPVPLPGVTFPFTVKNITARIANFYTLQAYTSVVNNFTYPQSSMQIRIGLITQTNKYGSTILSDYIWIDDSSRVSLGSMSWTISSTAVNPMSVPNCALIDYKNAKNPWFLIESCSGISRDQLCEFMCTDDPYPCGNCPNGIPQEMNNINCSGTVTSTKVTKLIQTTKARLSTATIKKTQTSNPIPSYNNTVCQSLPLGSWYSTAFRGDCYFIPYVYINNWHSALSWCMQFGFNNSQRTCRLADFDNFDDLKNVSSILMQQLTASDQAWIGMKTSCYCTKNVTDYIWTTSKDMSLMSVDNSFQQYMGGFNQISGESCVTVQQSGSMNNQNCVIPNNILFICRCKFNSGPTAINVTNCSTNKTLSNTTPNGTCNTSATTEFTTSTTTKLSTGNTTKLNTMITFKLNSHTMTTKLTTTTSASKQTLHKISTVGPTVTKGKSMQFPTDQFTKLSTHLINFDGVTGSVDLSSDSSTDKQYFAVTEQSESEQRSTIEKSTSSMKIHTDNLFQTCIVSIWSAFSSCSQTCGRSAIKKRNRTVNILRNDSTCPSSLEIINCNLDECNPMSPIAQTASLVLQILGCSWLIGISTSCFAISILLRSWDVSRVIHASQELALILAHVLILFSQHKTKNKVETKLCHVILKFAWKYQGFLQLLCTWVSIGIQYFFLVLFSFISLETVEMYAMVTTVTSKKNFFRRATVAYIGWGVPIVIATITAFTSYNHYVSTFTCWLNFGHPICFGTLVPVTVCTCAATVILESAGQNMVRDFAFGNSAQITTAKINQRSLLIMIPLQLVTWFFGQTAVYFQNIGLFTSVFGLHIALGCAIGFFHVLANAEGRALVCKLWKKK